ncbi:MAG: TlpA family protein disulfide reductase [bacterium]
MGLLRVRGVVGAIFSALVFSIFAGLPGGGLSAAGADASKLLTSMGVLSFPRRVEAPDFALESISGQEVKLSDFRGKVVFLNFWATWCPPCRAEMPSMERLHRKFDGEDFAILAVDIQESAKTVRKFVNDFGLTFTVLLDTRGRVASQYGVRGIPATFIIDREGNAIGFAEGARDWASDASFRLFEFLLDEGR